MGSLPEVEFAALRMVGAVVARYWRVWRLEIVSIRYETRGAEGAYDCSSFIWMSMFRWRPSINLAFSVALHVEFLEPFAAEPFDALRSREREGYARAVPRKAKRKRMCSCMVLIGEVDD